MPDQFCPPGGDTPVAGLSNGLEAADGARTSMVSYTCVLHSLSNLAIRMRTNPGAPDTSSEARRCPSKLTLPRGYTHPGGHGMISFWIRTRRRHACLPMRLHCAKQPVHVHLCAFGSQRSMSTPPSCTPSSTSAPLLVLNPKQPSDTVAHCTYMTCITCRDMEGERLDGWMDGWMDGL